MEGYKNIQYHSLIGLSLSELTEKMNALDIAGEIISWQYCPVAVDKMILYTCLVATGQPIEAVSHCSDDLEDGETDRIADALSRMLEEELEEKSAKKASTIPILGKRKDEVREEMRNMRENI